MLLSCARFSLSSLAWLAWGVDSKGTEPAFQCKANRRAFSLLLKRHVRELNTFKSLVSLLLAWDPAGAWQPGGHSSGVRRKRFTGKQVNRRYSNQIFSKQSLLDKKETALAGSITNCSSPVMNGPDPVADEVVGFDKSFAPTFLTKYWQKKPLMIRRAVHDVGSVVAGQDLLDLSIEEDVASRMVARHEEDGPLVLEYGPFDEEVLDNIPTKDWSILLQEVDRHMPSVADLWERNFSFLPHWRREDVMVSYSRRGGGIGAHVDSNDVFLIQGQGSRRWSIENAFLSHEDEVRRDVRDEDGLQVLEGFSRDQSWELQQGDMLYLPARIPHQGIALSDECLGLSMGFRGMPLQSMAAAYCAHLCKGIAEHQVFSYADLDPHKSAQAPGRVQTDAATLVQSNLNALVATSLDGHHAAATGLEFDRWLGEYLTVPLHPRILGPVPFFLEDFEDLMDDEGDDYDADDREIELPISVSHERFSVASKMVFPDVEGVLLEVLVGSYALRRLEGTRTAYTQHHVCFDGECMLLPTPRDENEFVGPLLCESRTISPEQLRTAVGWSEESQELQTTSFTRLLISLVERGYYYPVDL